MKTRKILILCLVLLIVGCFFALVACEQPNAEKTAPEKIYSLYVAYAEENGIEAMSYEQWLATVKGEKGDQGVPGEKGDDGATWLVGASNPNSQGKDGDLYLNTSTNDIFRKENGNWHCIGNIANQATANPTSDFVFAECEGGYTMLRYVGRGEVVTVPSTYNGKPVVQIGSDCDNDFASTGFYDCTTVKKIVIPEGVKAVGYFAFNGLPLLEEITLPTTLDTEINIPSGENYEDIVLPKLRINLSNFALWLNKSITFNVDGDYEFYFDGEPLGKNVVIPDGTTKIMRGIFANNDDIVSVFIPNSVTSIGTDAFYNCGNLTSVTIGNSITSIGADAFSSCPKLVEIYNLSTLTLSIGSESNGGVARYAKIVHASLAEPSALTITDDGFVFYSDNTNCYLVNYVGTETQPVLPRNFNGSNYVINPYAFYACSGLTSVTIGNGVTSIGAYAFYNCGDLTSVTFGDNSQLTSIGNQAFYRCIRLTTITIPNSVTSIGEYAFYSCSRLTTITIPNSVTSIGAYAFGVCYNLNSVIFADSEGWRADWNGYLSSDDLADSSKAATYLARDYASCEWTKDQA